RGVNMSDISVKELSDELQQAIAKLKDTPDIEKIGIVTRVGDGIAWIYGLRDAGFNEMIEIVADNGETITAFALNLMEDEIGAVLLGDDTHIKAGAKAKLTGNVLEVPV